MMDNRGQPIAIGRFFAVMFAITLVWVFLQAMFDPSYSIFSNMTTNATAQQGLDDQKTLFDWLPLIFLMISGFGLIAIAVYRKRFQL